MAAKQHIRIKTLNVLADKCADTSPQGFPFADPKILAWDYRKGPLLKDILIGDPDFITLQEIDIKGLEWFGLELFKAGYIYIIHKDCMIAYNRSIWEINKQGAELQTFVQNGQGFLFASFKAQDGRELIVATTHLKAKADFAEVRDHQVEQLIRTIKSDCDLRPRPLPLIVAGDFNAEPDEACCKRMTEFGMKSAYDGVEDHYTTYKLRTESLKRKIDYIWYDGLKLIERVPVPPADEHLPNASWPSDHRSLTAIFEI
jgi:mRNA deadenylase 3'-5' endonuclease subunit Ccr4